MIDWFSFFLGAIPTFLYALHLAYKLDKLNQNLREKSLDT